AVDAREEYQYTGGEIGNEKFGRVYGTDDGAGGVAFLDEIGRNDGSPSAAADGIEKSAKRRQHRRTLGILLGLEVFLERLPENQNAQDEEVGVDIGLDHIALDDRPQKKRSQRCKDNTWDDQLEKQGLVEVAEPDVREPRYAGGEDLRRMDRRRGKPRRQPVTEQHGTRRGAIGHAQRTVYHLCHKPGKHKPEEGFIEKQIFRAGVGQVLHHHNGNQGQFHQHNPYGNMPGGDSLHSLNRVSLDSREWAHILLFTDKFIRCLNDHPHALLADGSSYYPANIKIQHNFYLTSRV